MGCCETVAPIALLAFRTSRALERPLILHRLEKPEIKKEICVDIYIYIYIYIYVYIGGIPERETAAAPPRSKQVVRSIHPGALFLPTRVLRASTIRFALNEHV